jgi:hypothetical protein
MRRLERSPRMKWLRLSMPIGEPEIGVDHNGLEADAAGILHAG